ncbi:MAG TPA: type III pantothenate kinase [Xanthomonadaceae bacterium]|nr:type III pantothenate kinase [Xanthomonadaceae bacterium]
MLLIDLGTTRLKWALAAQGQLREHGALAHGQEDFGMRWDSVLAQWQPRRALLASVAPPRRCGQVAAALARAGCQVERVGVQPQRPGLRIAYADPAQFGVDRWLGLIGALAQAPPPLLLVSCGTAVTVDLVDARGVHRGGWIAPSPTRMAQAVRTRARHLPAPDFAGEGFASDSAAALGRGCEAAAAGLVERAWRQAQALSDATPRLVLTGGDAAALARHLPMPATIEPSLVLQGLAVLSVPS